MTRYAHEILDVFRAAAVDVAKNILRPLHNLAVVLGLERETDVDQKVNEVKRKREERAGT